MSDSTGNAADQGKATSPEPIISVRDLVVRYDDRLILDRVNLDIRPGETMVILGASGSGKSTLLRHMEGLARPIAGGIFIKGVDLTTSSEKELNDIRRLMGISFQSAAMFNSMTVGENVALPLREHTKLADSTIRLMTRMKLAQVGLSGAEDLYPAQLSGGMRKRASMARAMAMDPEILFFDEPSAGLDPIIAAGIDELIVHVKKAFSITIVVVTHNLESAFFIADRMCMLHQGKMIAVGSPDELRQSKHPHIRRFFDRVSDQGAPDQEAFLSQLMEP